MHELLRINMGKASLTAGKPMYSPLCCLCFHGHYVQVKEQTRHLQFILDCKSATNKKLQRSVLTALAE